MAEGKNSYEVLAEQHAQNLERTVNHPVSHGNKGFCPSCGSFGLYDLKEGGLSASSIYYSTVFADWRCQMCEFESVAL